MTALILAILLPIYTDSTMRETVKAGDMLYKDRLYWVKAYPCNGTRFVACKFGDPKLRGRYLYYDDKLCEMYYSTEHLAYYDCQLYAWDVTPMSWDSVVAGAKRRQATMLKGKYKYSFWRMMFDYRPEREPARLHGGIWMGEYMASNKHLRQPLPVDITCYQHSPIPVVGTPKDDKLFNRREARKDK